MTATVSGAVDLGGTVSGLLEVDVASRDRFAQLCGLALRDNPRRAHLVVSRVLGKHVPVAPGAVLGAGAAVGEAVAAILGGIPGDEAPGLVIGYCETATGLGHAAADRLGAAYLHTTRRLHPGVPVAAAFEEEHSHAVAHALQPAGAVRLDAPGPLVLVDDELTSGRTALNTVAELHARWPRERYVVATLLDARTPAARAAFAERADALGVRVDVAAVLATELTLPAGVLDRAAAARAALPAAAPPPSGAPGSVVAHEGLWPAGVPTTARHGLTPAGSARLAGAADAVAASLAPALAGSRGVLVLGTEELMHAPTVVGARLAGRLPGVPVTTQSTTRSPVHAADDPGYALRRSLAFPAPDDPARVSRVHNLADPAALPATGPWSDLRADDVVVVVDAPAADAAPMAEALRPFAARAVHLVTVPVAEPVA
ncbi:phosphoribosyltransferase-like predicted ribonucleoside biosynthesis protein [Geodermatophilus normandii]|uniref:Phosphoribosyltransferase-like predicted ribonucleoside biosynthesis protein n=1 Tax=Geodermatophilus normandii TaxID=1137989 RepID=A0A317QM04_9ACTN|nr:phosphoribosyltransferase domain-containing protein [Geodermatophilus normandii]PWW23711.1 phosphoribosyltransferase-like predicted ribonucleoside biosynthesis protein [Geodermatophilus normandii]